MIVFRHFSVPVGLLLVFVLGVSACSPEAPGPHVTLEQARAEHEAGKHPESEAALNEALKLLGV